MMNNTPLQTIQSQAPEAITHSILTIPKGLIEQPVQKYLKSGINPIVDSAALLFMFASRLRQFTTAPPWIQLQQQLTHEFSRFQVALQQQGYSEKKSDHCLMMIATLFEIILKESTWHAELPQSRALLTTLFPNVSDSSLQVFCNAAIDDQSMDLVEFIYLSYSLGFSHPALNTELLKERCYHLIQQHSHQEKLTLLSPTLRPERLAEQHAPITLMQHPGLVFLISATIFFTLFSGLYYALSVEHKHSYALAARVLNTPTPASTGVESS